MSVGKVEEVGKITGVVLVLPGAGVDPGVERGAPDSCMVVGIAAPPLCVSARCMVKLSKNTKKIKKVYLPYMDL